MSFVYQPIYIGGVFVGRQFSAEYRNQTPGTSSAKSVQRTMEVLQLRWDLQSGVLLGLLLLLLVVTLNFQLEVYFDTFLSAELPNHIKHPLLNEVFNLGFCDRRNLIRGLIPMLVDAALHLNTLF